MPPTTAPLEFCIQRLAPEFQVSDSERKTYVILPTEIHMPIRELTSFILSLGVISGMVRNAKE